MDSPNTISLSPSPSSSYPPPHIIPPSSTHKTTLILLHGTSTSGPELAANLAQALPNTRFVFPTGKLRATSVFGGRETNAWFDVVNFADRTEGEDLAIPGIFESIHYLTSLIRSETLLFPEHERGKGQIIFGGFSQGAAMSLMLLLSNEWVVQGFEREVGGWVLMSGWLPFARQLQVCTIPSHSSMAQRQSQVISWLRNHVGLGEISGKGLGLGRCDWEGWKGAFMGHGMEDKKMLPEWAKKAKAVLEEVGWCSIRWREYKGLGHWFEGEELGEVIRLVNGNND
ncbi:Alpha/Beta hydrolase protein [Tricladium varicosporioides]|nr:Alpha/Beta hydrolase protein [Hymenoscyphus varicosporioides]